MASYELPEVGLPNNDVLLLRDAKAEAVLPELVDNGAKNRLYFTDTKTGQDAGCVYTVNADGSITVNVSGKTGNSYRILSIGNVDKTIDEFCDGNYVLSGCPSGGGASNAYRLYAAKSTYSAYDYGSGVILPSRGSVTGINVVIYVDAGYIGGNLTFKPMICKKAEWDISQTFESYGVSNSVLTSAAIKTVNDGAKNLLYWDMDSLKSANPNISSSAWNGNVLTCAGNVTITFNVDGTCTLNGTSSAGQTVYFTQSFDLPQGNYIWSAGTLQKNLWSGVIDNDSSEHNYTGSNNYIALNGITPKKATIYIESGLTFSNKVLYPMLTTKAEWDVSQSFEKYALPNPTLTTAAIDAVDDGAKNRLLYTLATLKTLNTYGTWNDNSYTRRGITFTINSDLTIVVTGINDGTGDSWLDIFGTGTTNDFIGMVCSGCPKNGAADKYALQCGNNNWDYGTAEGRVCVQGAVAIVVRSGYNASTGLVFKPMICTKNDWLISKNYTPPAMSNAELTAKTIKFVDVQCYLNNLVFTRSYGTGSNDGSWYTTTNDSVSVPGLSTIYSVSICGWESLLSTDFVQPYITANGTKIAFLSNTDSFRSATYIKVRAIGI